MDSSAPEPASKSPTSPGVGGYALAIGISLITLALEISIVDAVQQGRANDLVDVMIVVVVFGAVPAAVIGSVGAAIVHVLTRWATSQWPAVLLAAALGLAAGLIVWSGDYGVALLLSAAAGTGRLAVVPRTRRRAT